MLSMAHARSMGLFSLPTMNLARFQSFPILQQLHLEERLFRTSSDNWCIINDGTDAPTIVMGISGKPLELIEAEPVYKDKIPVIKRFSGGGTVIVDGGTIFVTFICNKEAIIGLQLYPRDIMSWTGQLYNTVFHDISNFHLQENDYAFTDRKFGGNAQSISKSRWLHHTSFLWDYEMRNMRYLKVPAKAPAYRLARNHADFICPLKEHMRSRSEFIERILTSLGNYFTLKPVPADTITSLSAATTYTCATKLMTEKELQVDLAVRKPTDQLSLHVETLGSL